MVNAKRQVLINMEEDLVDLIDKHVKDIKTSHRGYNRTQFIIDAVSKMLELDPEAYKSSTVRYSIEDVKKHLRPNSGYSLREMSKLTGMARATIKRIIEVEGRELFTVKSSPYHNNMTIYIYDEFGSDAPKKKTKRRKRKQHVEKRKSQFYTFDQTAQDNHYPKAQKAWIEKLNTRKNEYGDYVVIEKHEERSMGSFGLLEESALNDAYEKGLIDAEDIVVFVMSRYFEDKKKILDYMANPKWSGLPLDKVEEDPIRYVDTNGEFEERNNETKKIMEEIIENYSEEYRKDLRGDVDEEN